MLQKLARAVMVDGNGSPQCSHLRSSASSSATRASEMRALLAVDLQASLQYLALFVLPAPRGRPQ